MKTIWKILKSIVGAVLAILLFAFITCIFFGIVLRWEWVSYGAQILLPAIYGFMGAGAVLLAIDEITGKKDEADGSRKLSPGMKVILLLLFTVFAAGDFYLLSWIRHDDKKQSYIILVKDGSQYDVEKVETYVDYHYLDGDKSFTIHPKKDSAYVINLSQDTLELYTENYNFVRHETKRSWTKTTHINYFSKAGERVLKVIAPHKHANCGKMDDLNLFDDKGKKSRALRVKKSERKRS